MDLRPKLRSAWTWLKEHVGGLLGMLIGLVLGILMALERRARPSEPVLPPEDPKLRAAEEKALRAHADAMAAAAQDEAKLQELEASREAITARHRRIAGQVETASSWEDLERVRNEANRKKEEPK